MFRSLPLTPVDRSKIRKVSDVSAADFLFDNNGQQYNVAVSDIVTDASLT